ncbi:hypothetical protein JOM56_010310 [Amanita muscaria]
MSRHSQKHIFSVITREFDENDALCSIIAHARTDEGRDELVKTLKAKMVYHGASEFALENPELLRSFFSYCGKNKTSIGGNLSVALAQRSSYLKQHKRAQRMVVDDIGLNWKSAKQDMRRDAMLSGIPELEVVWLDKPYPPLGHWVCDTPEIYQLWEWRIKKGPLSDTRSKLSRKPLMHLDWTRIKTIQHKESVRLVNKDGELVGLVIRNFCKDVLALNWINSLTERAVGLKKSCRPNDPGSLVIIGFSPGARSKPSFDWVRNVTKKIRKDDLEDFNYQCSSAFAFFWNLARSWLPQEIIRDFDNFIQTHNLPAMNPNFQTDGLDGKYTAFINGVQYEFSDARLAPPQAYFGGNYAAAMHDENPPHEWAISLTTGRDPVGPLTGGQFYMAQYGVRVEHCANTLVAWKPKDVHGTGLQCYNPESDVIDFLQTGMSFSTSGRLLSEWHALENKLATLTLD